MASASESLPLKAGAAGVMLPAKAPWATTFGESVFTPAPGVAVCVAVTEPACGFSPESGNGVACAADAAGAPPNPCAAATPARSSTHPEERTQWHTQWKLLTRSAARATGNWKLLKQIGLREEECDLLPRRLRGVGAVNGVALDGGGVQLPQRPRLGLGGVGGAHHAAQLGHRV